MTAPQSLSARFLAACEFDREYIRDRLSDWQEKHALGNANKSDIAQFENARLRPLLEAAADVIAALEFYAPKDKLLFPAADLGDRARAALSALRERVEAGAE